MERVRVCISENTYIICYNLTLQYKYKQHSSEYKADAIYTVENTVVFTVVNNMTRPTGVM